MALVQQAMARDGLDAILVMDEANVRYFSGFRTLFWQSPTRPWFLVLPAKGEPVAVIPEIGATLMGGTWVKDIRTWASPDYADDGVSLLASVISAYPTVGLPSGRETVLRMPLQDFRRLEAATNRRFVDASNIIRQVRRVKSAAEISYIEAICGIASTSFANAPNLFCVGQRLDEAFRAFKIDLLSNGAEEVPYLVGGAGADGYLDVISPASPRKLAPGDVLMLDTGATLAGYFCDFDRNFAFSHASDHARQAYATLYQSTEAGLAAARPGVTCGDLYQAMAAIIGDDGGTIGRLGHGLGIELTEPPSIIPGDDTVLEAGMVMTLEPSIATTDGRFMVQEENIVIRDGAPQLLSRRAPEELAIL